MAGDISIAGFSVSPRDYQKLVRAAGRLPSVNEKPKEWDLQETQVRFHALLDGTRLDGTPFNRRITKAQRTVVQQLLDKLQDNHATLSVESNGLFNKVKVYVGKQLVRSRIVDSGYWESAGVDPWLAGDIVWRLPSSTTILINGEILIDSPTLLQDVKKLILDPPEIEESQRAAYWNAIASLVIALQKRNYSTKTEDNLVLLLKEKFRQTYSNYQFFPLQEIYLPLEQKNTLAVHDLFLPKDWMLSLGAQKVPEWDEKDFSVWMLPSDTILPWNIIVDEDRQMIFIQQDVYESQREWPYKLQAYLNLPPDQNRGTWRKSANQPSVTRQAALPELNYADPDVIQTIELIRGQIFHLDQSQRDLLIQIFILSDSLLDEAYSESVDEAIYEVNTQYEILALAQRVLDLVDAGHQELWIDLWQALKRIERMGPKYLMLKIRTASFHQRWMLHYLLIDPAKLEGFERPQRKYDTDVLKEKPKSYLDLTNYPSKSDRLPHQFQLANQIVRPQEGEFIDYWLAEIVETLQAEDESIPLSIYINQDQHAVMRMIHQDLQMDLNDLLKFLNSSRIDRLFSALAGASELRIQTGAFGKIHTVSLIPVFDDPKKEVPRLVDIEVRLQTQEGDLKDTIFERISSQSNGALEAAQHRARVASHYPIKSNHKIHLRGLLDLGATPAWKFLSERKTSFGTLRFYTSQDGILAPKGLPLPPWDDPVWQAFPPMMIKMFQEHHVIVDLVAPYLLYQDLRNPDVQSHLFIGGLYALLELWQQGKVVFREIPYDFVEYTTRYEKEMLARGRSLRKDLDDLYKIGALIYPIVYHSDQQLTDLLCMIPFFPQQEGLLSILDIAKKASKGEKIEKRFLLPRQMATLIKKTKIHSENQQHDQGRLEETAKKYSLHPDDLKTRWIPSIKDDNLGAHGAFLLLVRWMLRELNVDPIKRIGFSTTDPGAIAHTNHNQTSPIFWELFSVDRFVRELYELLTGDATYSRKQSHESEKQRWNDLLYDIFWYTSHELVHNDEFGNHSTHNRAFYLRQAKKVKSSIPLNISAMADDFDLDKLKEFITQPFMIDGEIQMKLLSFEEILLPVVRENFKKSTPYLAIDDAYESFIQNQANSLKAQDKQLWDRFNDNGGNGVRPSDPKWLHQNRDTFFKTGEIRAIAGDEQERILLFTDDLIEIGPTFMTYKAELLSPNQEYIRDVGVTFLIPPSFSYPTDANLELTEKDYKFIVRNTLLHQATAAKEFSRYGIGHVSFYGYVTPHSGVMGVVKDLVQGHPAYEEKRPEKDEPGDLPSEIYFKVVKNLRHLAFRVANHWKQFKHITYYIGLNGEIYLGPITDVRDGGKTDKQKLFKNNLEKMGIFPPSAEVLNEWFLEELKAFVHKPIENNPPTMHAGVGTPLLTLMTQFGGNPNDVEQLKEAQSYLADLVDRARAGEQEAIQKLQPLFMSVVSEGSVNAVEEGDRLLGEIAELMESLATENPETSDESLATSDAQSIPIATPETVQEVFRRKAGLKFAFGRPEWQEPWSDDQIATIVGIIEANQSGEDKAKTYISLEHLLYRLFDWSGIISIQDIYKFLHTYMVKTRERLAGFIKQKEHPYFVFAWAIERLTRVLKNDHQAVFSVFDAIVTHHDDHLIIYRCCEALQKLNTKKDLTPDPQAFSDYLIEVAQTGGRFTGRLFEAAAQYQSKQIKEPTTLIQLYTQALNLVEIPREEAMLPYLHKEDAFVLSIPREASIALYAYLAKLMSFLTEWETNVEGGREVLVAKIGDFIEAVLKHRPKEIGKSLQLLFFSDPLFVIRPLVFLDNAIAMVSQDHISLDHTHIYLRQVWHAWTQENYELPAEDDLEGRVDEALNKKLFNSLAVYQIPKWKDAWTPELVRSLVRGIEENMMGQTLVERKVVYRSLYGIMVTIKHWYPQLTIPEISDFLILISKRQESNLPALYDLVASVIDGMNKAFLTPHYREPYLILKGMIENISDTNVLIASLHVFQTDNGYWASLNRSTWRLVGGDLRKYFTTIAEFGGVYAPVLYRLIRSNTKDHVLDHPELDIQLKIRVLKTIPNWNEEYFTWDNPESFLKEVDEVIKTETFSLY